MKRAEELYKKDEGWCCWYDYQPMLNEFGEILIQVDEDNWQGDSFLIYKDRERYGLLIFGWGSCSGCDALQACSNIKQVQELMDGLYDSIEWFDSVDELKNYFTAKDWKLTHVGYVKEFERFYRKVLEL